MIHFNTQLKQEEAKWVLDQWFILDHRVAHPTLSKMMEMHNKIFEEQVGVPSCSCEYLATHGVWRSRLNQYKDEINNIAFPKPVQEVKAPVKAGRKKKTTE